MIDLRRMCDRCFRIVGDNEEIFGFKLVDENNIEKDFIGHKECVEEMAEIIQQLYGKSE